MISDNGLCNRVAEYFNGEEEEATTHTSTPQQGKKDGDKPNVVRNDIRVLVSVLVHI